MNTDVYIKVLEIIAVVAAGVGIVAGASLIIKVLNAIFGNGGE